MNHMNLDSRKIILTTVIAGLSFMRVTYAQEKTNARDSIVALGDVMVKGFETHGKRMEVPASVSVVGQRELSRYANTSMLPAINTVPGVRMEERSPGSYRLSLRGSLLRSPFGVRNVKVYWDDLPFTDAGGNTYLNLVDMNTLGSVELLKGPAGSLYGANTGGVVVLHPQIPSLLNDSASRANAFRLGLTGGSFGMLSENAGWKGTWRNAQVQLSQVHQQSGGYRENSRFRRDVLQGDAIFRTGNRNQVSALLLLADLFYNTPGGLTQKQMDQDPRMARPATPATPSATAQKAAVYNKSLVAGITNAYRFSPGWELDLSALVSLTRFRNPFITNYEQRNEQNLSLRAKLSRKGRIGQTAYTWVSGMEWIRGWYRIDSTGNKGGVPDANLVRDRVGASQGFLFTQFEWKPFRSLLVQAGLSLNRFHYDLERIVGEPMAGKVPVPFDLQWVPRLAILYHPSAAWGFHASISKGYSPPSIAEVRPSAGGFDTNLQAEYGWSGEAGLKLSVIHNRLQADLSVFRFDLQHAIVRRTNASGAEYYINAGGTRQTGLEAFVEGWPWLRPASKAIRSVRLWSSFTLSDFSFRDYHSGTADYSGKSLTGVPHEMFVSGADIGFLRHWYLDATFTYIARIWLNDANDAFAPSFTLWQFRGGWKGELGRHGLELFAGVDNAGNVLYSLGNDLNAFGKRYFNPAPGRNAYAGVNWRF
jgi:iron complex outermembrane receptor protein